MANGVIKWSKRASLMYVIGIWTMCGSYGFYSYKHRNCPQVETPKEEEPTRPNVKTFKSANMSATIVYKENFVPYSTRLLKLFGLTSSSSSGSQADDK